MRSSSLRRARAPALAALLALGVAVLGVVPAQAQIAFNISLDSDYRFRGISLSGEKPTATFNLAYDHASGAYAGLSAIGGDRPDDDGFDLVGQLGYVGYARRIRDDIVLDLGATNSKFTRVRSVEYSDFYLGILKRNAAFHLHYAPNYFDLGQDALYSDLNAWFSPAAGWRLSGHAGWLDYVGDGPLPLRDRSDFRITLARAFERSELRVGVVTAAPALQRQEQTGVVAGVTVFF